MRGVIAAGGPETAAAATEILNKGGNAVDAAVAAAFASFIGEIGVVHLGGSGMAQIYVPKTETAVVYDFFSNTPGLGGSQPAAGALDFDEVMIDFGATTQYFHLGRASVAVPGNIFGLCQMAADHGNLSLPELLEPAMRLARDGVILEPFQADTCALLTPLYTNTASMRAIFTPNGRMIQAGERLMIPDLLETLQDLAGNGAQILRNGRLAQALITDQKANHGLLTAQDLQQYQVYTRAPIRLPYHGYEILLPPPSSTGGVLTAFTMKLMARFYAQRRSYGKIDHLRLLYEIMAATTRARPFWDDADSDETAVNQFLNAKVIDRFEAEIRAALAQDRFLPGIPEPPGPSSTSHLSVIDENGMTVSLTTTAGESAGFVVPGTGFIPNNIMGEEDLHPNGFHSQPAGERIATMMTPTIVLQNNQPRLAIGSGGSARIRSAIMQVLSNLLDFRQPLIEAVNNSRVHIEDGVLQCEAGYDETAVAALAALGYPVNRWSTRSIYFGGAHSVSRTKNGRLVAAGDDRRGGATASN